MRFIYKVRTGSLHPTLLEYWFTDYYYSSKAKAETAIAEILEINMADAVREVDDSPYKDTILSKLKYSGEFGKYEGMIVLEKIELL